MVLIVAAIADAGTGDKKARQAQLLAGHHFGLSDADGTRTRNHRIDSPGL